jgi:protein-tyrosine phosphatase
MSITVLFVCLGNICRSPMAEGVFQTMVDEAGLGDKIKVDSAGTGGWHAGEMAHPGTRRVLQEHGVVYHGRARQITPQDLQNPHHWVIAMDNNNLDDIRHTFGDHPRLHRLLEFAQHHPNILDVPDPYYNGKFAYVYELIHDGCTGLLTHIRHTENI